MDLIDTVHRRQVEHRIEQDAFQDRTQSARAGLPFDRLNRDRMQRVIGELELDILHVEQLGVLLYQCVLRLDQDLDQRRLVEIEERRDDRQAADELGDQAELEQILGLAAL